MKRIITIFLVLLCTVVIAPTIAEATKSASWNQAFDLDLYHYRMILDGDLWAPGLRDPNVTVSYYAEVRNCDTNEIVADGATVPVGTRLAFQPVPHQDTHISWFGTGYTSDSPYGHWVTGAAAPLTVQCLANDYLQHERFTEWIGSLLIDYKFDLGVFVPLNVDPPDITITQSGSAALASADVEGCRLVESTGTIKPVFTFSDTQGKFYYRWSAPAKGTNGRDNGTLKIERSEYKKYRSDLSDGGFCTGDSSPMRRGSADNSKDKDVAKSQTSEFTLAVPVQTIAFSLTAAAASLPPDIAINGPLETVRNKSETFTFVGNDPEGKQITYHVDWNNDGLDDIVLGPVDSGTPLTAVYRWSTLGTKTFQAFSKDADGARSSWATHTINVSEGVKVASCTAVPSRTVIGQPVTWTATVTGGQAPYSYSWSGTDGISGTGDTVTYVFSGSGDKAAIVTVTDATGAADTYTCGIVTITVPLDIIPPPLTSADGVSLTTDKTAVRLGDKVILLWDVGTNDPQTCTIIGSGVERFVPVSATGGQAVTITGMSQFRLDCPSGSDTAVVKVVPIAQET